VGAIVLAGRHRDEPAHPRTPGSEAEEAAR